jgi:hypothetical protein
VYLIDIQGERIETGYIETCTCGWLALAIFFRVILTPRVLLIPTLDYQIDFFGFELLTLYQLTDPPYVDFEPSELSPELKL